MKQIQKVPTGIEGFDGLLSGGIPKGLTILVSGNSGTGKTIFSIQYLYEGITQFKENAVFVACEESSEKIKSLLVGFGWDLEKLEKEGKLIFIDAGKRWITDIADESTEFGLGSLLNEIEAAVRKINAKRVVIDPSTSVLMPFKEGIAVRRALRKISAKLESLDCTSIITAERPEMEGVTTRFNIENFVLDGVIVLRNVVVGNKLNRILTIEKMRGVKQDANVHKFDITNTGIIVT
jgi:circadian clock protein KaiC